MVDRIRALLLARQLSPTQFADAIGVARPIMSHILSGRNKPSLEVVQKVLAAFPDLSMPWLLSGAGPMLASAAVPAAPAPAPETPPQTSPETAPKAVPVAPRGPAPRRAVAPAPVVAASAAFVPGPPTDTLAAAPGPPAPAPEATPAPPPPAVVPAPFPEATGLTGSAEVAGAPGSAPELSPATAASAGNIPPELALFAEPGKAIRRIVIFYRDGTFADYQPE